MNARKRRVALLRNNFLPYSETFIHDEIRHHERYDVTVLARRHSNADRFPGHHVVAVEGPTERRPLQSAVYGLTGFSRRLERAVKQERPDLVHAHFGHNGLYAMGFARRHGIPLVVSLHGRDVTILLGRDKYHPEWWHYLLGHQRLFRQADLFLAASNELKTLITSVGCPAEKVVVHRLGVDVTRFEPGTPPGPGEPAQVVMVGRFVEKKGHQTGIRAVARARDAGHDLRLTILGDGPLRPDYEGLLAELGLTEQVDLPGACAHAEVVEHMRRATVVLAPSVVARNLDRESGLIAAKEAAACAVPVVGTIHGGIPEIIDDEETGFLVPEHDDAAMGARLCELLANDDLRGRMGVAARAKMEREYDIRERVRGLEDLYDRVVDA